MIGMMYLVLTAMLALNVSKDILDGFTRVDSSLHSSIDATYGRNQKLYFEFKQANEENPEKTREMYAKAGELRRKSDSLYNYIQDFKVGIVKLADGPSMVDERTNSDPNGDPTRDITNKDNKDVTGQYTFIEVAEDGRPNGEHLKEAIGNYREFMCSLVREHDPQLEGQLSSLFSTADIYNKNDHKDEEWTHATFDEVPICASITLLTKIQNDIRACEGQVLKYLFDRTDAADLRVNKFEAHVIPDPSDYVMRGGRYRAKIILAAVDSTKTPDIFVEGTKLGPDGIYEVAATAPGPKTIKGYLTFLDNEGTVKEVPFEHSYTVGEPSVSISNKDLNVIYASYDNKYSVSVPGISSDKLKIIVEGGTLKDDKRGNIEVRPTVGVGSKVKIIVQANVAGDGKYVTMGTTEYDVKRLQIPEGFINYGGELLTGKVVAATLTSDRTTIAAAYPPEVLLKIDYVVVSFQTKINGQVKDSNGNKFSKDQINQIKKLKSGTPIKFQAVKFRPAKGGEEGFVKDFYIEL